VQLALSADRLFGYHHWWLSATPTLLDGDPITGIEVSEKGDQVALLTGGSAVDSAFMGLNAHAIPRLGVDVVLGPGVTVGGSLSYYSSSGEITVSGTTAAVTQKNNKIQAFGVSARVGYAVMFTDVVGIWPRAGITYGTQVLTRWVYPSATAAPTEQEWDVNYVSVDPEFLVVLSPVPNFGLLVGLTGSIGATGGFTAKSAGLTVEEGDMTANNIGVTAGLMGYL
jgi:hypothetical protein